MAIAAPTAPTPPTPPTVPSTAGAPEPGNGNPAIPETQMPVPDTEALLQSVHDTRAAMERLAQGATVTESTAEEKNAEEEPAAKAQEGGQNAKDPLAKAHATGQVPENVQNTQAVPAEKTEAQGNAQSRSNAVVASGRTSAADARSAHAEVQQAALREGRHNAQESSFPYGTAAIAIFLTAVLAFLWQKYQKKKNTGNGDAGQVDDMQEEILQKPMTVREALAAEEAKEAALKPASAQSKAERARQALRNAIEQKNLPVSDAAAKPSAARAYHDAPRTAKPQKKAHDAQAAAKPEPVRPSPKNTAENGHFEVRI